MSEGEGVGEGSISRKLATSSAIGPHLAIVGSTASGKSRLALELARHLRNAELVSVDSMQVYRGMDVGTAKPSRQERHEICHHLIDLVDANEEFALAEFQAAARTAIADIESRNKRAILVGGTGLYLQSVIDDLHLPGQFPDVRQELESQPDTERLHARLQQLDPMAAAKMEPNNRRRVIRALEVTLGSGKPFSSFGPGMNVFPPTRFHMIGLWLPREVGGIRIDQRVDAMIEHGWIEEVRTIQGSGGFSRTAAQALGYKELVAYLEAGVDLSQTISEIKQRTRSFARRQRMWFRRDPRIHWYATAENPHNVFDAVLADCEQL